MRVNVCASPATRKRNVTASDCTLIVAGVSKLEQDDVCFQFSLWSETTYTTIAGPHWPVSPKEINAQRRT